jgi:hypothetical protein
MGKLESPFGLPERTADYLARTISRRRLLGGFAKAGLAIGAVMSGVISVATGRAAAQGNPCGPPCYGVCSSCASECISQGNGCYWQCWVNGEPGCGCEPVSAYGFFTWDEHAGECFWDCFGNFC